MLYKINKGWTPRPTITIDCVEIEIAPDNMRRRFYGFNNRFRTTKNTEAIVFENGGFVGNLGLSKKLWKKVY